MRKLLKCVAGVFLSLMLLMGSVSYGDSIEKNGIVIGEYLDENTWISSSTLFEKQGEIKTTIFMALSFKERKITPGIGIGIEKDDFYKVSLVRINEIVIKPEEMDITYEPAKNGKSLTVISIYIYKEEMFEMSENPKGAEIYVIVGEEGNKFFKMNISQERVRGVIHNASEKAGEYLKNKS